MFLTISPFPFLLAFYNKLNWGFISYRVPLWNSKESNKRGPHILDSESVTEETLHFPPFVERESMFFTFMR